MEKLAEAKEREIRINFIPNCKCRATVTLRSLSSTSPISFKVQTSSPDKFLVNPPSATIPPLSLSSFQVILKPQPLPPPSFPRSPSDRFLVKITSLSLSSSSLLTQNLKLKVAFTGPFLLRHAVTNGDVNSVRGLIKRDRSLLAELPRHEAESVLRVATQLDSPEGMVHVLLEAGLRVEDGGVFGSKGWDELHVAVERGDVECVRVLLDSGAGVNIARCRDGRTPLIVAAVNGDRRMVGLLVDLGADPTATDDFGRSALDVARDEGHKEIVEIMEQGEEVIAAARHGDVKKLKMLLKRGANVEYRDQYGLTALHAAAMKGHREMVAMLVEAGLDLECEDEEGHVPLHMAVESGDQETIQVLVNEGVNVNSTNKKGVTPLYMAKVFGHDAIAEFLVSKGAMSCFPVILR